VRNKSQKIHHKQKKYEKFHQKSRQCSSHSLIAKVLSTKSLFQLAKQLLVHIIEVLKRLMCRIHRIRPEYCDPEDWFLLHDNAPSHTSLIVRQFLARNRVSVLNHSPYSPDLAPCDFSLFPKLKLKLKGRFFNDIPTIQASTQALEAIPQTELEHAFESLLNRCNKCIEARREYFE